ncbi:hypothetical protein ACHAWF_007315 [Thalassiosira exigua]
MADAASSSAAAADEAAVESAVERVPLAVAGGGIGGLVLALCLDAAYNHPPSASSRRDSSSSAPASDEGEGGDDGDGAPSTSRLPIHVYESASAYRDEAGGAVGLYPNGLRVLRDLSRAHPASTSLLDDVRGSGCDYLYRRWMRHDGTEVAAAREDELLPDARPDEEEGEEEGDEPFDTDARAAASPPRPRPEGRATRKSDANSDARSTTSGDPSDRRPRGGSFGFVRDSLAGLNGGLTNLNNLNLAALGRRSTDASNVTESAGASDATGASPRTPRTSRPSETELLSIGIRRWRFQRALYDACSKAGIQIHFGKRLERVTSDDDGKEASATLHFMDGTKVATSLLIGADGINSRVRTYVADPFPDLVDEGGANGTKEEEVAPEYTGVTCLMGCANVSRVRGICFPSSATTRCHACYYPTRVPSGDGEDGSGGEDDEAEGHEMVFQIYFPSPLERPDEWRTLTPEEAKIECAELAKRLREDGWDESFLEPLEHESLTGVLRVGLRSRRAPDRWHVGGGVEGDDGESGMGSGGADGEGSNEGYGDAEWKRAGRAVLLGDAAHPPVPYIGQGAMMAMEDAGTLAFLLGRLCPVVRTSSSTGGEGEGADGVGEDGGGVALDLSRYPAAVALYESLRVPRTRAILGSSVQLGMTQQRRAESKLYNAWREASIKAQVWAHGTLPVMRPGAAHDYKVAAEGALEAARKESEAI